MKVKTSGEVPSFLEVSATTLSELGSNPLFSISLTKLEPIFKTWIWEVLREVQPVKEGEDKYLTRREACDQLRISLPTLTRYSELGIIPVKRLGNRILYLQSDIEASLKDRSIKHK